MPPAVEMAVHVQAGVGPAGLPDVLVRTLLAHLMARARVVVGHLVAGAVEDLVELGPVSGEEGLVGGDDPVVPVDDEEGPLVGLGYGLEVNLGGHL